MRGISDQDIEISNGDKVFIVGNVQKQADRNKIICLKGKEKIDSSEPKKIVAVVVDKSELYKIYQSKNLWKH